MRSTVTFCRSSTSGVKDGLGSFEIDHMSRGAYSFRCYAPSPLTPSGGIPDLLRGETGLQAHILPLQRVWATRTSSEPSPLSRSGSHEFNRRPQ